MGEIVSAHSDSDNAGDSGLEAMLLDGINQSKTESNHYEQLRDMMWRDAGVFANTMVDSGPNNTDQVVEIQEDGTTLITGRTLYEESFRPVWFVRYNTNYSGESLSARDKYNHYGNHKRAIAIRPSGDLVLVNFGVTVAAFGRGSCWDMAEPYLSALIIGRTAGATEESARAAYDAWEQDLKSAAINYAKNK